MTGWYGIPPAGVRRSSSTERIKNEVVHILAR